MKKLPLIILVICVQVLLIFFEVHKQSQIITVQFQIQKLEQKREEILKQRRALSIEVEKQKQPHTVYNYAAEHNLRPVKLADIQTLQGERHAT